ncbi:hypothetical protein ASF11_21760 [Acidovorax sp. Leaf76]|uniref:hypothetical protein n=1 Tax=unclassified Acidovorax TaxID=2684926 RepID=UPI000700BC98|nr:MULTISPECIES: hypothetical protein [unclassified Acidovorax]KQO24215.1 hypothetical protein ASF11_21760 [Acidovorax sp. Leaf76]KQS29187.1 hypothetical protein ASG27_13290 [Acidovorax sp. Leaf191]
MPQKPSDRNFLEAALDNVEVLLDAATENEAVKAIPILGTAIKLCKGYDDLRNKAFAAKIYKFVMEPSLQSAQSKASFAVSLHTKEGVAEEVGEALFLTLEKLADMRKPALLAQVFVGYLDEVIDLATFRRLAAAIDQAYFDDIELLLEVPDNYSDREGLVWKMRMLGTGLVAPSGGGAWAESGMIFYKMTELATSFRKAVAHAKSVAAQAHKG